MRVLQRRRSEFKFASPFSFIVSCVLQRVKLTRSGRLEPYRINSMLHEWILKHTEGEPPIPDEAVSPWKDFLGDYEEDEDTD